MGCHYCNDRGGRRDHRKCCDWDKLLFGDRRRCGEDNHNRCRCNRDNVLGAEDNRRGCRGRKGDNVLGAENNHRKCGCKRRHRNCFCNLFW